VGLLTLDSILVDLIIILSVSQVLLMTLCVYFAIRITRIVGTFQAWTLMIIAFALLAARDFTSLGSLLAMSSTQLSARLDQFTLASTWPGQIISELSYLVLAVGIYGLLKIFGGQEKQRPKQRRQADMLARSS
jgi:cell shape-determining protein MreD